jgi:hypothetical protein
MNGEIVRANRRECDTFPCNCEGKGAGAVEYMVGRYVGRWYVTMGHCGFNSKINNSMGYATEKLARASIAKYGTRVNEVEYPADAESYLNPEANR